MTAMAAHNKQDSNATCTAADVLGEMLYCFLLMQKELLLLFLAYGTA